MLFSTNFGNITLQNMYMATYLPSKKNKKKIRMISLGKFSYVLLHLESLLLADKLRHSSFLSGHWMLFWEQEQRPLGLDGERESQSNPYCQHALMI